MILLIIYILISCNSTSNYNLDVSGVKLDAFGKRGNYIDSIDNRINDRIDYYMQENEIKEEINNGEVINMESDIQSLITAITSAIAGVYCLVKTIINLLNKIKK